METIGVIGVVAILSYIATWGGNQALLKHIVGVLPRARSLFAIYVVTAVISLTIASISGYFVFEVVFVPIFLVGAYNAWGAYAQFRAYTHSLSRSTILIPLRFVVSMALAAIFLGEASLYASPWIPSGAFLLFAAAWLLSIEGGEEKEGRGKEFSADWLISIFAFILIAGSASFFMKLFASELEVPRLTFLSYWYLGALIGAVPMLLLEKEDHRVLMKRSGLWVLPAGAFIILQLGLQYWVYQLIPLAVAEPIMLFGTTLGPLLLGLFVFKEIKEVTKRQLYGFLAGGLGVLMLIVAQL